MRKVKLVTDCDRAPNYLMDIGVKYWLKTFDPSELIFLVNNTTGVDMVESLKKSYGIEAKRANSIEELYNPNSCVVWDYLKEYDQGKHYDRGADLINQIQHRLLEQGVDVVIFLDRDEILYHPNLREVLNTFTEPVIRPTGIEVIQNGDETELDLSRPIYEQRKYLRYFPSKSKPCISQEHVSWIPGRHATVCGRWPHADTRRRIEERYDPQANTYEYPGLYLIHFDKVDINRIYALRLETRQVYKTNDRHTGVLDEKLFTDWFNEAAINGELYLDTEEFLKKVGV